MNHLRIKQQLEQFLIEDIGVHDISTNAIFPAHRVGEACFFAKETGVLAGAEIIKTAYQLLDPTLQVDVHVNDGEEVTNGDIIATVKGAVRTILTGERVILNMLQRMSGIATMTNQAVQIMQPSNTKICDTRKTTPGFRMFEKYAVTCGGGYNHRIGLYDGVMIKDNHIAFAGSIRQAIKLVRHQLGPMVKIEVETESEAEVNEAIDAQCDVIMFDNQSAETIAQWQKLVPSSILTEVSGGITLENLSLYRHVEVDFISLGCLTHSVQSLDISLGGM